MTFETALETRALTIEFGGLKALSGVDLKVAMSSIFGLIGPNGAGKTTLFNLLTGIYRPSSGEVFLGGRSLAGLKPHEITRRGLARTFQNIRLFKELSVLDNVRVAVDHAPAPARADHPAGVRFNEARANARARELLSIFALDDRRSDLAKNLPYGDQRKLEIARALGTGARVLLLDEPAAGLNAQETAAIMETLVSVRARFGVTLLLIEHDMRFVMGLCGRIAVLDYGIKIAEGTPAEIRQNTRVIEAYLGTGSEGAGGRATP